MSNHSAPKNEIGAGQLLEINKKILKYLDAKMGQKLVDSKGDAMLKKIASYLQDKMAIVPVDGNELIQQINPMLFENSFLLEKLSKECEKYSFENQVKQWISFYADRETYGLSQSQLEDFVAKSNGENPKNDMLQLILSPATTVAQDLAVLEKITDVSYENKGAALAATDPKWDWSKDRLLWVHDLSEAKDFGIVMSHNEMMKTDGTFMDFKPPIQLESFLRYVGKIPKKQPVLDTQSVTFTTSLDGGGDVLSVSFSPFNGNVCVHWYDVSNSGTVYLFQHAELIYQN